MRPLKLFSFVLIFILVTNTTYQVNAARDAVKHPGGSHSNSPASIIMVTNNQDSGTGSLRAAIANAVNGDTIHFAGNYTIYLASDLVINKTLTIDGSGHSITISGDTGNNGSADVRHFTLGSSAVVELIHLNMVNGSSSLYGIPYGGSIYKQGTLTVTDCTFTGNYSPNRAGAIYNDSGEILLIQQSTFTNNSANQFGGAIANYGPLTIVDSTFDSNSLEAGSSRWGGAINSEVGPLNIHNSTFVNNSTPDTGGALLIFGDYDVNIFNTTFSGNSAGQGGAIGFLNPVGTVMIKSSTFSGNSAVNYGGGIAFGGNDRATLQNSIIANNTAGSSGANCAGVPTDGGGNLNWGEASGSSSCPGVQIDPQLGSLANNGGPAWTILPSLGSPAIDAVTADAGCLPVDARGVVRPQRSHCDIGAMEVITISGNASVAGVSLAYNDGGPKTTTSAADGTYEFAVSYNWAGTVTPSKTGLLFIPDHRTYTNIIASHTGQYYYLNPIFLPLVKR
jgi:predicted outer membrane repeat protein